MIDAWFRTIFDMDFDHVEAPWQVAGAEALEPGVRAAFDERLLGFVHRVEWADFSALAAGFHFHEEQEFPMPGDDVHFAAAPGLEVPGEDAAAVCTEKIRSDVFTIITDPFAVAGCAVRCRQAAGRV